MILEWFLMLMRVHTQEKVVSQCSTNTHYDHRMFMGICRVVKKSDFFKKIDLIDFFDLIIDLIDFFDFS